MSNVANGNLIVHDADIDIPERGIDLAFVRVYNSQSQHDYANTDGSVPSNFGDGWTNNFDAHMGYDSTRNEYSVYDIDGARYDYCANGTGWVSCTAGQHATLSFDGGCGYFWTKKNGTTYHFYSPQYSTCAGSSNYAGYNGRLYYILGRNQNNWIRLDYSWDNGIADSAAHLARIYAVHSDGQELTLKFSSWNGIRLLGSVVRPDVQYTTYDYDGSNDLVDVCGIGNGTTDYSSGATAECTDTTHIEHTYGWYANHQMKVATSPKWKMNSGMPDSTGSGGSYVVFVYDGANRVNEVYYDGYDNFTPNDGTTAVLQPDYTNVTSYNNAPVYRNEFFTYNSGNTAYTDTDGHATTWYYDSSDRVTQTREWTGTTENLWLVTGAAWDSNNNLIASDDARGNETDYGYDGNGNTLWVESPAVATNVGTIHPIARYAYDNYNNLVAYCDPNYVYQTGATSCPSVLGVTRYTWSYSDSAEPYGYLTDTYTQLGYHHAISYNTGLEGGGDYGLPTSITGDTFTQLNGTSMTPSRQFTYDADGNIACYSKLQDSAGTHWWRLTYDTLNRATAIADPDDASLAATVSCANSAAPGIAGSHITTTTTYYANGQIASMQSPSEYAKGVSTTGSYDGDGNLISTTDHYGNTAATTTNWYDGADQLVEVELPHDATDYYSFNWLTRNLYDLSAGGTVSLSGSSSFHAYGDLYKTQEWLPSPACSGWTDTKGTAYDGLDRATTQYLQTGSCTGSWAPTTFAYDSTSSTYGLLAQKTDPLSEVTAYAYDNAGHTTSTTYSGDGGVTPNETNLYDPDGRVSSVTSSTLGALSYTYDADGRLTKSVEPSGMSSAATLSYAYYPNAWRQAVSVTSAALTQSNLIKYNYRSDGETTTEAATYGSTVAQINWTLTPNGRVTAMTNSAGGNRQMAYDAQGRLASDSGGPGAPYGSFVYDDEGQPTSYSAFGQTVTQGFTDRGEFQNQVFSSNNSSCPSGGAYQGQRQQIADGYPVQLQVDTTSPCGWKDQSGFSVLTGLTYSNGDPSTNGSQYSYDNAGRQTSASTTMSGQNCVGDTCDPWSDSGSYTKQYDAENHLIGQTYATWPHRGTFGCPWINSQTSSSKGVAISSFTLTYVWGPNGHPVEAKNTAGVYNGTVQPIAETLHWDGDGVLFTTNASGAVDDIKLGADANITISGSTPTVTYDNRDFTGAEGSPPSPTRQLCNTSSSAYIFSPGPDGISDSYNIFQGVRNYDPVLGTWSTPDAYQGVARDPMSQHAYMWNNNNAFIYSDPSGYCAAGAGQTPNADDPTCTIVKERVRCSDCRVRSEAKRSMGGSLGVILISLLPRPQFEPRPGAPPDLNNLTDKILKQMKIRGWDPVDIERAYRYGTRISAWNKANGNSATRYVDPLTNKSVVIDDATGEVIQVGGEGFRFGPESGDVIEVDPVVPF